MELTRAVADGKMSAAEAGAEWRRYAETQQVVGQNTLFTRENLGKLVTTLGVVTAGLGAMAIAGQKAWDYTEHGTPQPSLRFRWQAE